MAGSWRHMTTGKGKLLDSERFCRMVENLGDAYETAEECFGMIWWLAGQLAACQGPGTPGRDEALDLISDAQAHYKAGLNIGGVRRER